MSSCGCVSVKLYSTSRYQLVVYPFLIDSLRLHFQSCCYYWLWTLAFKGWATSLSHFYKHFNFLRILYNVFRSCTPSSSLPLPLPLDLPPLTPGQKCKLQEASNAGAVTSLHCALPFKWHHVDPYRSFQKQFKLRVGNGMEEKRWIWVWLSLSKNPEMLYRRDKMVGTRSREERPRERETRGTEARGHPHPPPPQHCSGVCSSSGWRKPAGSQTWRANCGYKRVRWPLLHHLSTALCLLREPGCSLSGTAFCHWEASLRVSSILNS